MIKLLKMQLLSFFDVNKAIHCKDPKEKRRLRFTVAMLLLTFITLFGMAFFYTYLLAKGYEDAGVLHLFLPLLMLSASLITFITTFYKANGVLFGYKDYEMLMSLPVKTSQIIGSRVLLLYLMSLLFNLLIMIPGVISYAYVVRPDFMFYISFGLTLFFIPLIPIILATLIGTLISFIASRFKSTRFITLILTFVCLICFMFFNMRLQDMGDELIDISQMMVQMMNQVYPLSTLYEQALSSQRISALLLFIGLSLAAFILFVGLLAFNYKKLNTHLAAGTKGTVYQAQTLKTASPFMALYKKELRRYFASTLYVFNTGLGAILLIVISVIFVFAGSEGIETLLQTPGIADFINPAAPFVLSILTVMSCTTSCAISLEGNNLWIVKSLPIKGPVLLMSKVAVNLTILVPAILLSSTLFAFRLQTGFIETLLLYLLPLAYGVFIALAGIIINLKCPVFNWASETIVIKQSLSAVLGPLTGLVSVGIPGGLFILNSAIPLRTLAIFTCLCLLLVSLMLYAYIYKEGDKLIYQLN